LQQQACDLYQGHLFSKALPASQLEKLRQEKSMVAKPELEESKEGYQIS